MSTVDNVTEQLKHEIASGIYSPGSRLPTRHDLMSRYQISRASVDRVIGRLRKLGYVESHQGSGTYLTEITPNQPQQTPTLFLVHNTHEVCLESGPFDQRWAALLSDSSSNVNYTLIGSEEIASLAPKISSNNNARIIWNRPPINAFHWLQHFKGMGSRQIVINRPFPDFNYVTNDTRGGLDFILGDIAATSPNATFRILSPSINPMLPFLTERELYFYELAAKRKLTVLPTERSANFSNQEMIKTASNALSSHVDYLFIPDSSLLPFILTLANQKGIALGVDLSLITFGWLDNHRKIDGVICLNQDWDGMFRIALEWALESPADKIQSRIMPHIQQS